MRKQIAAANWKMNLTYQQAEGLLDAVLQEKVAPAPDQLVLFAVPFPYLVLAKSDVDETPGYAIAAQNCSDQVNGAYTGEVSVEMLQSMGIRYCIIGHSERREYFAESNELLARKVDRCLEFNIQPLFCCGEALAIRESGSENAYVQQQLEESLFHLSDEQVRQVIIAYEPIWAIGTGKTASAQQAQDMHAHIRSVLAGKWGKDTANEISILYGGSVKAGNAAELFGAPDVDGGLVGGASLVAQDFVQIIKSLQS
ncbi:triose-phosphate isomerase [Flaviaesturariibacter aridisoli]|uniref:Triosephosphate isomerase n=1 Tax=Flaviaesturariibacter aridisoli TaxID=2545761 RepID=A0A4V2WMG4_9BACT|nr:triose-phosphate isomerase [Flaviaesturariibacter aridisoli]TCZ69041.1 triose-phosphate isomerase [Flaviaesturariibacter aridisoli]